MYNMIGCAWLLFNIRFFHFKIITCIELSIQFLKCMQKFLDYNYKFYIIRKRAKMLKLIHFNKS